MLKELCASREQELNDITDQLAHVTAEKEKLAMDASYPSNYLIIQ